MLNRVIIDHDRLHARCRVTPVAILTVKLVLLVVGHRDVQTIEWLSDLVSHGVHSPGCIPCIVIIGNEDQVALIKDVKHIKILCTVIYHRHKLHTVGVSVVEVEGMRSVLLVL